MIVTGVVADERRGDMGANLARLIGADFLSVDTERMGCAKNHSKVWRAVAAELDPIEEDWGVVLEEDAVPCEGFQEQLAQALQVAPAPIVSLYLGCGYIDDRRTDDLLVRADLIDANWLVTQGRIMHAVALAVRGDLIPALVDNLPRADQAIDRTLSMWARRDGHRVAYANPSLVDHADRPSLVTRYQRMERRAWRTGTRNAWRDKMMPMT